MGSKKALFWSVWCLNGNGVPEWHCSDHRTQPSARKEAKRLATETGNVFGVISLHPVFVFHGDGVQ